MQPRREFIMDLRICPNGNVTAIYGETIDLSALGQCEISRASYVEPTENGMWLADLTPVGGPVLGPYPWRSLALDAEIAWLQKHLIGVDY